MRDFEPVSESAARPNAGQLTPSAIHREESLSASVTRLLHLSSAGDKQAESHLFRIVFGRLRNIAAGHLRNKGDRALLEPTELVNEAYLHVFGTSERHFVDRAHFFAVAARAMRCILVDLARKRRAAKRDWGKQVELNEFALPGQTHSPETFLAFDSALAKLAEFDSRAARIVELKVFIGLTNQETGKVIGMCTRTVRRDSKAAKAWLEEELRAGHNTGVV